jgi:hypothetical protein
VLKLIVTALFTFLIIRQPADLDTAARQRIDAYNSAAGNPVQYRVLGQTADDMGGILYLEPRNSTTDQPYPGVVDWAVALHDAGGWSVYLPGDNGYTAAYERLPAAILLRADSTPYTILATPSLAGDLSGYRLPWADSAWATVTRSYHRHGTGRIDFDLTGRDVVAAKNGTIIYASDGHSANAYPSAAWWYWNTIVIQHGAHEFSLYGHLAPGSIPQWIKDACAADLSAANCAVPVKAGQVIAQEGSTGYSSNPHLHLEFGQGFAVAAYMDTADEDGDGNRAEPVYAAYIYAEQNVSISGYTADEIADWPFGKLVQAAHGDPLPVGVNLLRNGDFSAGTDGWTPSGQLNWAVQDGVMRATRLRTSAAPDWAAFYQDVTGGVAAHTPFAATLQLGNAGGIAKTVTVSVFNKSGRQYGLIACAFVIPANAPLQQYMLEGEAVNTWAAARFEVSINPPDGAPAALIDGISLNVVPSVTGDQCITPA